MNDLEKKVRHARRRINWQHFTSVVAWTTLVTMVLAGVAIATRKFYPLAFDGNTWNYSWFGGALAVGIIAGVAWTWVRRSSNLDAAIEIDRRFGLKERVASSLSLAPDQRESQIGQALVKDTVRRVARVDVRDQFSVQPNRWSWLPLALGAAVFCLAFFVQDAKLEPETAQGSSSSTQKKQIKKSTEELAKRLAEQKKRAEDKNLPEAEKVLTEIQQTVKDMSDQSNGDRRRALRKLSEMTKDLKSRRDSIGSGEELRKQLNDLKNIKKGPADKLAKALKDGDFAAASKAMEDLREKMADGNLSDKEKSDLSQQMQQMQEKLQQMADSHERAKQELEKQIQQKLAQGDTSAANKLQEKLDGMNQQTNQMNQLQQMAQLLDQASEALDSGEMQEALAQLDELTESLDALQQQLDQLEMLDEAMDQIAMAKEAMT